MRRGYRTKFQIQSKGHSATELPPEGSVALSPTVLLLRNSSNRGTKNKQTVDTKENLQTHIGESTFSKPYNIKTSREEADKDITGEREGGRTRGEEREVVPVPLPNHPPENHA